MKKNIIWIVIGISLLSCSRIKKEQTGYNNPIPHDTHVHLMSPFLINEWKEAGIPFSKPDAYYSNIDTILKYSGADTIDLISMAHVYGNPDFYTGKDEAEKVQIENNYLYEVSLHHPDKITPFFSVDPLKDYALTEIERCHKKLGMPGLKLHFNASRVYLTKPEHLRKLKPIFRYAAEHQLPVLLHLDNGHPEFGKRDVLILADSLLKDLPAITLKIAHFGTSGGFTQKTKTVLNEFINLFNSNRIPERHTILFDISAVALDKNSEGVSKLSKNEFAELKTYIYKIGIERVVFGTDYPLYPGNEYASILKQKVGLTESEMETLMTNDFRNRKK